MIEVKNGHILIVDNNSSSLSDSDPSASSPKLILLPSESISSSNEKFTTHHEVMLPVVFIIFFMMILFLVYALTNLEYKRKIRESCCFFNSRPNQMIDRRRLRYADSSMRAAANGFVYQADGRHQSNVLMMPSYAYESNRAYRKSIQNPHDLDYYEDTNGGFYRLQNSRNMLGQAPRVAPNFIFNHDYDYDRIYPSSQNYRTNIVMPIPNGQYKLNQLYRSQDTNDGYELAHEVGYEEEVSFSNTNSYNTNSDLSRHVYDNKNYFSYTSSNNHDSMHKSASTDIYSNHETKQYRRSYSNSKIDHLKWQQMLKKHRPDLLTTGNAKKWQSRVQNMTEYELKRFLNRNDLTKSSSSNFDDIQALRGNLSEGVLNDSVHNKLRNKIINKIKYNQNELNAMKHNNSLTTNSDLYSNKNQSSQLVSSTTSGASSNNSYNIHANKINFNHKAEKNPYMVRDNLITQSCFGSIPNTYFDITDKNNNKNEQSSLIIPDKMEHPSIIFNCSEINTASSEKAHKLAKKSNYQTQLRYRSSTFKTVNNLSKFQNKLRGISNENIIKTIYKELRLSTDDDNNVKYKRLSKSNMVLTSKSKRGIVVLDVNETDDMKTKTSKLEFFLSEPTKLSKQSLNNNLKSIDKLKSNGLNDLLTQISSDDSAKKGTPTKDTSIQTSTLLSITDNSSFNSTCNTLQSNTFGSIVAHFGSASVQASRPSGGSNLLRAYSDGHCLSSNNSSKIDDISASMNKDLVGNIAFFTSNTMNQYRHNHQSNLQQSTSNNAHLSFQF